MTANIMKTPRSVDIEITSLCNLRCKYCSHFTSSGDVKQDLSTKEWLKFFEELNRCAVLRVCLQGGEPFCRKDIREIISGIVENRMRFSILSNGALVTDEIAAFLHSSGRCDYIQISIDGSTASVHDSFRGIGSFAGAIKGINILQKHDICITSRVTIHKKNLHDLENIVRFLLEEIGIPNISVNSAVYMGSCRQNRNEILLDIEEQTIAMERLLKLNIKYNSRITSMAGPLTDAKSWIEMKKAQQEKKERFPKCGYLTACGCVMNNIAVRADGIIIPCVQMGHIELSRINEDELENVWRNHPELWRLRDRRLIPLKEIEFCNGCDYINYCTGNCPAVAYNVFGNDQLPNPDACLKRFLDSGGKLPDEHLFDNLVNTLC